MKDTNTSVSVKMCKLSFYVLFWFTCVFHPKTSLFFLYEFPFLFLFLCYLYLGTFSFHAVSNFIVIQKLMFSESQLQIKEGDYLYILNIYLDNGGEENQVLLPC